MTPKRCRMQCMRSFNCFVPAAAGNRSQILKAVQEWGIDQAPTMETFHPQGYFVQSTLLALTASCRSAY